MGYVKYRSDEERTEARRLAKERKQEFFNTPEGKRWKKNTRLKACTESLWMSMSGCLKHRGTNAGAVG